MSLARGDPAKANDVWTRVITSEDYWTKKGTLNNAAFGGKAITEATDEVRWTHELSGRLLSLIRNLEKESVAFCEKMGKPFAGIMYQKVENLRSEGSGFPTDVIYTPNDDEAHADLVIYEAKGKEQIFAVRDWLQDFIQYVRPDKTSAVCSLREAC